jgi:hypothetical protein
MSESTSSSASQSLAAISPETWLWWMRRQSLAARRRSGPVGFAEETPNRYDPEETPDR